MNRPTPIRLKLIKGCAKPRHPKIKVSKLEAVVITSFSHSPTTYSL
jgi:hypothetical protein